METGTRIDHITGGIYRIATWVPDYGITFNQFLIDDERPTLIHTGDYAFYEKVRGAISKENGAFPVILTLPRSGRTKRFACAWSTTPRSPWAIDMPSGSW